MAIALTAEQKKLVENNYRLIYKFAGLNHLDIENVSIYDALIDGLCITAVKYNPEYGAFSTLAFRNMRNVLNRYYRDSHTQKRTCDVLSLDYTYSDIDTDDEGLYGCMPNNDILPDDLCCIRNLIKELFDDRQQQIIICLYKGTTYREIADKFGISYPRVGQIVSSIRKKLSVYYPNMV